MENNQNSNKNRKILYTVLTIVFALGAAITGGIYVADKIVEYQAQKELDNLAALVTEKETETVVIETETETETEIPSIIPEMEIDWEALGDKNEDIYAWISVPGTEIEYPVLQHPTDDNYYLNRNVDHSKGYPGCIYTQSMNAKDFSDFQTVLYGHNMKNGSMFAGLHEFEDNEFFEENSYIYIYTPEKEYAYEIFGAYEFSDAHLMYAYDYSTEYGRELYLKDVFDSRAMNTHYREDVTVDADSRIITLSTCIKGKANNRYLVQGVLVEEKTIE